MGKNKRFELLFPPPAANASSKDDAALAGVSSPLGGSGELLEIVHGDHKLALFCHYPSVGDIDTHFIIQTITNTHVFDRTI